MGLIPFNLNPHYLDADLQSKHMGETRETRIKEFHAYNAIPVLGLREGSWLDVKGNKITLKGELKGKLFRQNQVFFKCYGGFYRQMLGFISYFFVQNEESKTLLNSLGITKVVVSGDTRFDRVAENAKNKIKIKKKSCLKKQLLKYWVNYS